MALCPHVGNIEARRIYEEEKKRKAQAEQIKEQPEEVKEEPEVVEPKKQKRFKKK